MLEVLKTKDGVEAVHTSAEGFFFSRKYIYRKFFNKFIICGSAHYFSDTVAIFASLFEHLTDDGACVIVAATSMLPLFKSLRDNFKKAYTKNWNRLYETFKQLDVKWKETNCMYQYNVPKSEFYAALRNRYLIHLEQFTDEEIEAGIAELEKEYNCDTIELEIDLIVCIVTKA